MASFLIQKYQHPVDPNSAWGCMLLQPFDVITVQADGWAWGDQELTHPWFRIVNWSAVGLLDALPLLAPLDPVLDASGVPTTLPRLRASYLNMNAALLPLGWTSYWNDDTRSSASYSVLSLLGLTLGSVLASRPVLADPSYVAP